MELFEKFFWVVPVIFIAFFLLRFIKSGSLTGAFLGGKIERELGEIQLAGGALYSNKVKVYQMRSSSGEVFVGVSFVAKAPLAASMTPFKLTKAQATMLSHMLAQAAS